VPRMGRVAINRYKAKFGSFGEMIYPLPALIAAFQTVISFGLAPVSGAWSSVRPFSGARLSVLSELKLLISGDQGLLAFRRMCRCTLRNPSGSAEHWLTRWR